MKKSSLQILLLFGLFSFAFMGCTTEEPVTSELDYYQLKKYTLSDESQEARLDAFLKNAYLPAVHRAGINKVGVFKPVEEDTLTGNVVFVWMPFQSLKQFEELPGILDMDVQFLADGKDYIEAAHDNVPYERIESSILKAFTAMPHFGVPEHTTPAAEKIYELRSYEGPTEKYYQRKVEMFNEGGETALFKKLEFQPVFFAEVISGSAMPNLVYMTTFANKQSREEHWDAFRKHPEWEAMKGLEQYKNTVSHADIYLLHPTDYSDI